MGSCCGKSTATVRAEHPFELDVLAGHAGGVNTMAVSDDETLLATGSDDGTIRLWTTQTMRCECVGLLEGHTRSVRVLASGWVSNGLILSSSARSI